MLNCWWVTCLERKLNSISDVLVIVAESAAEVDSVGERGIHLSLESEL